MIHRPRRWPGRGCWVRLRGEHWHGFGRSHPQGGQHGGEFACSSRAGAIHDSNSRLWFKITLSDESLIADSIYFESIQLLTQHSMIGCVNLNRISYFDSNLSKIRFKIESNQCNWFNHRFQIWIESHDLQKKLNRPSPMLKFLFCSQFPSLASRIVSL